MATCERSLLLRSRLHMSWYSIYRFADIVEKIDVRWSEPETLLHCSYRAMFLL